MAKKKVAPKGSPENPMTREEAREAGVDVEAVERAAVDHPEGDFIIVRWNGGERVYSQKDHGDDFVDLAKEFAAKFNGTIV